MGQRVIQTIYECSLCGKIPEDGQYLWHMANEIWCEECCEKAEMEQNIAKVKDSYKNAL